MPALSLTDKTTSKINDLRVKRGKVFTPKAIARSREGLLPEGKGLTKIARRPKYVCCPVRFESSQNDVF